MRINSRSPAISGLCFYCFVGSFHATFFFPLTGLGDVGILLDECESCLKCIQQKSAVHSLLHTTKLAFADGFPHLFISYLHVHCFCFSCSPGSRLIAVKSIMGSIIVSIRLVSSFSKCMKQEFIHLLFYGLPTASWLVIAVSITL